MGGAAARQGQDWTLVEGLTAAAMPAGITTRHAYETLRDELLQDLRNAGPVDVALFGLHGAMVADGYDDCGRPAAPRARDRRPGHGDRRGTGSALPSDRDHDGIRRPHRLLQGIPHTDILDRAYELVDLCVAKAEGRIRPTRGVFDCQLISVMHTSREPMRGFVDKLMAMEGKNGVLSISIAHGFPGATPPTWAPRCWSIPMAIRGAEALARELGQEIIGFREQLSPAYPPTDEALDQALAHGAFPVVLADSADNAGGGAPSDATFILERVLARGIEDVAMGPFWDPVSVQLCFEAGEGAEVQLRVGGKVAPVSGQPLDLRCTVLALKREAVMTGLSNTPALLGDVAILRTGGVVLALTSLRTQAMGTDMFTQFGIDLAAMKLIVVKSSQHFYASYSQVAKHVIYVATPGAITQDYNSLPYRKVRRPKWPLTA